MTEQTPAEREARRTALILAAAQAIVGSAAVVAISLGALAGQYLLDADKSLATAPVTGFNVGVALGAIPAAALIRLLGQRNGFQIGNRDHRARRIGRDAARCSSPSFWLFVAGLVVIGLGGAFVQQFRFAAADNAPPEFKARAISFVLAGGVFTAIIGPQIVIFTRELLAPVMFAGSFAAIIALAAVGAVLLSFLRVREKTASHRRASSTSRRGRFPRSSGSRSSPSALLCAVGSYALMSFVMTGAPLAMVGCGFSPDDAAIGISWHVMAMFGPSFFTGALITRFGKETIVATGLILLIACAIVALSGIQLWQFWTALILLGLGWNFAFIGATAMVAGSYRNSEKGKVQGVHDFVLFGSVAFGSLMSGAVYNAWGWEMLNWIVFPVTGVCLIGLAGLTIAGRRKVVASRT